MSSCLIIAGEKSGEEHCLSFFKELKNITPGVEYYGVGGDTLQNEGLELIYHIKDFSSWGISEVVKKLPFYFKAKDKILAEVDKRNTKVAILIDFQDFNLRLAQKLKKKGVKVLYYVAPQAWAWRPWRAKTLGKTVHTLFTLLPFEKSWFQSRGVENTVQIVHPVFTEFEKYIDKDKLNLVAKPFIKEAKRKYRLLLLPGSRNFEVSSLLPEFEIAYNRLKNEFDLEIAIVKSESVRKEHYDECKVNFIKEFESHDIHEALTWADVCFAASGTVTLTTALFQVPTVVCYKASLITQLVFESVVVYDGPVALGNIMHDKMVFPELIQEEAYGDKMARTMKKWLTDQAEYEKIKTQLATTEDKAAGDPVNVAKLMGEVINNG